MPRADLQPRERHVTVPKLLLVIAACLLIAVPASAQADRRTGNEFLRICASDAANPEVIKGFLDRGVDVDLKDRSDDTALLLCARRGDVESCVFLLEQGADVNVVDANGKPALAFARVLGLPVLEQALLEAGARESLATVIVRGRSTVLDELRRYPLSTAACAACIESIRAAGFDVADLEGERLLCAVARKCMDPKGVEMVINAGVEATDAALFCAAMNPSPEVMRFLLKTGLDVNARNPRLTTPFFRAASFNTNPEVLRLLIEAGAEVDIRDDDGDTPLHQAAFGNNDGPRIVAFLLELGMDPDARNNFGETPLATACRYLMPPEKASRIVQSLIEAGADVDARTNVNAEGTGGATPLLLATCGFGQDLGSVRLLIESGADVNARATGNIFKLDKGQTAIFPSIISQNQKLLPLLIELGADVNLQDDEGLTPLDVALGRGDWVEQPWAVELLRAAGAKEGAGSANSKD